MGTELIIAVGALVLALVAFSLTQGQSKQIESEAKKQRLALEQAEKDLKARVKDLEFRLESNLGGDEQIRQLRATVKVLELRALEHDALLCSLVTEDEAHHLWNVSREDKMTYTHHGGLEAELRSLVRRGLLKKQGHFKIHELPGEFDLHDRFALTDTGEMLLALRKHLQAVDTRPQESMPPPPVSGSTTRQNAAPPFVRPTGS